MRIPKTITLAAFAIIGGGCLIFAVLQRPLQQSPPPNQQPPTDVVTQSIPAPAENPIAQDYATTAKGEEPAFLNMPSIDIKAPVQKVGVDQRTEIAVPNNIHYTGWFVDSATPGEPGLSIINGHVDGLQQKGVFNRLAEATQGTIFTIERGDKQVLTFEIFATKTIPTVQAATHLFSQDPTVKSQLNLITCTGKFDKDSHTYDHRTIVYARRKD